MALVPVKINGKIYEVEQGISILAACRSVGIEIPTLCYLKDINEIGACRICLVEVKGARTLVAACVYPIDPPKPDRVTGELMPMEIRTNSASVIASRRMTLELILSTHNRSCLSCVRSGTCELQKLCQEYGIENETRFAGEVPPFTKDDSAVHMVRDNTKCILCRRCSAVCAKYQHVGVIGANDRGFKTHIGTAFEAGLGDVACVNCGQCINYCPTGALHEKDQTQEVFDAIADPKKHVIVQTAPSVRVGLGEPFGMPIGTIVTGKMVTALKMLGFDRVFDTNFAADLTIMEEATEFLERYTKKENLPLITSCSPGWIKFCETYFPDFIPNLSSCKSPQGMFGAVAKTYYAEKMGIDPKDIFVVSVMPCTAKKFEAERLDHTAVKGLPDIDAVLTVRELARMIKKAGILFNELPDDTYDAPFGLGSGAGTIFGATGGVMEAALRTAYETLTGETLEKLEFNEVRGTEGIKEATYTIAGNVIRVAVCSGTANAKKLLTMIRNGEKDYDFVEIMACPGGCVNGGGQPIVDSDTRATVDVRAVRAKALYGEDAGKALRKSHENAEIKAIYADYLGKPGGHRSHELLHTHYTRREKYTD